MRAFAATAACLLGLMLAVAPSAWANRDCQTAFERWATLSSARVRAVPQTEGANRHGACLPTEAVRHELLDGLTRALSVCAGSFPSDKSVQQAAAMLTINQSFIASLDLCRSESAEPGAGWSAKSAPAAKPAPPPAPPPKAVVAAPPPPKLPKPAVAAPPPSPPCLEVSPAKEGRYALVNRRCGGHTVLAVIETRGAAGETVCRGYTVTKSVAVRSFKDAAPLVNHECVLGGPCNKDRLGGMFPECDF